MTIRAKVLAIVTTLILALAAVSAFAAVLMTPPYKTGNYTLDIKRFRFSVWEIMPPHGWSPGQGSGDIGNRLPYNWDDTYRNTFKQLFQPVIFYRNAAALCNYVKQNPDSEAAVFALFDEMVERAENFTIVEGEAKFIRNDFDFPRIGVTIPSGWVSAIANAFIIAGFAKFAECDREHLQLAKGYVEAYRTIYPKGDIPPHHWISYVDENEYLWFDEYPLPDGQATRVLNGHLFAVFAMVVYERAMEDDSYLDLAQAGIKTIEDNVWRFRKKGGINYYDLRGNGKLDYLPARSISQQCQLFLLTGVEYFRIVAGLFSRDFAEAGVKIEPEAMKYCS